MDLRRSRFACGGLRGNAAVMKLCDLLELWMEKRAPGSDVRYLTDNDTQSKDADGLDVHHRCNAEDTCRSRKIKSFWKTQKKFSLPARLRVASAGLSVSGRQS